MKRFSKKQIVEAISYWNNQLKMLNESFWTGASISGENVELMTRGAKTITLFNLLDMCDSWFDIYYRLSNDFYINFCVKAVNIVKAYVCESQNIIIFGASFNAIDPSKEDKNYFDTDFISNNGVIWIGVKVSSTGKLTILSDDERRNAITSYKQDRDTLRIWQRIVLQIPYHASR